MSKKIKRKQQKADFVKTVKQKLKEVFPEAKPQVVHIKDPIFFGKVTFNEEDDPTKVLSKLLKRLDFIFIRTLDEKRGPYAKNYIHLYKFKKVSINKEDCTYEFILLKENAETYEEI